jgi:riboflavin synthase
MFTGIVEAVGTVAELMPTAAGFRLRVRTPYGAELSPGDSLAVNGVCLTVTLSEDGEVHADIGPETARITTLAMLQRGDGVNLERPMRIDGRLGGHLVSGHVDGIGIVRDVRAEANAHWIAIGYPPPLAPYFIGKGSVAVDGVSLTVADLGDDHFDLQIVPFTWNATTFSSLHAGRKVNLECDLIGKYVVRAMALRHKSEDEEAPCLRS